MNHLHPDDELLSAALDGEADPGTIAHFGDCDDCLSRLDTLDRVRQQVAAVPAPAPAGVADRAVAAATAAWRDERGGAAAAATAPAAPPRRASAARAADQRVDDDIVPLRRRPPAPAPARSSGRRVPGWAFGAAAAVVAALLAVPFLVGGGGSGEQTASAPTEGAADQAFSLDAGAVDGGELGSLSDEGTLREELLRAVPGAAALAQARTEAAAPSGDSSPAPAAAPTLAAGASTTVADAAGANEERTTAGGSDGDVPCRDEIRAQVGDRLGPLLYTAALRWQDTDAVVLAYRLADTSGPGADHLAFVMARDDCRVLTSQGF